MTLRYAVERYRYWKGQDEFEIASVFMLAIKLFVLEKRLIRTY